MNTSMLMWVLSLQVIGYPDCGLLSMLIQHLMLAGASYQN